MVENYILWIQPLLREAADLGQAPVLSTSQGHRSVLITKQSSNGGGNQRNGNPSREHAHSPQKAIKPENMLLYTDSPSTRVQSDILDLHQGGYVVLSDEGTTSLQNLATLWTKTQAIFSAEYSSLLSDKWETRFYCIYRVEWGRAERSTRTTC